MPVSLPCLVQRRIVAGETASISLTWRAVRRVFVELPALPIDVWLITRRSKLACL